MTPTIRLLVLAAMLIAASSITANADVINVTGSTQGNFNGGTTATTATLGTNLFGQPALTFQGQAFNTPITTGNPAVTIAVGQFRLLPFTNFNFNGDTFNLVVTFTAPPGAPGGGQTFTANLSGIVSFEPFQSTIDIDFDNTPQVFNYNGGTFSFSVQDLLDLHELQGWTNLNAQISATANPAVPEPASMLLLGSGVTGIAIKLRRRRRAKLNKAE